MRTAPERLDDLREMLQSLTGNENALVRTAIRLAIDELDQRLSYLTDPDDPCVVAALKRKCSICDAKPGRPCWNICDPEGGPLPNRLIHHYRIPANMPAKQTGGVVKLCRSICGGHICYQRQDHPGPHVCGVPSDGNPCSGAWWGEGCDTHRPHKDPHHRDLQ